MKSRSSSSTNCFITGIHHITELRRSMIIFTPFTIEIQVRVRSSHSFLFPSEISISPNLARVADSCSWTYPTFRLTVDLGLVLPTFSAVAALTKASYKINRVDI